MNRMLAGNTLTSFGASTVILDRSVPLAASTRSTNGFFRGIVFGFAAVIPVWTGIIWFGLKLFNHG